jgi:adenosylmethionine-8-amino-7-oxononanoate aminotransferase
VDETVAAVLVEPMVQGAAGMRVHDAAFLRDVEGRCRAAGALLVADEVMTGFGRTGRMFACEHAGVRPDVVCLAKGITGGLLPLAATVVSERVFAAFRSADRRRALFHGHSFTANPIACAVAVESLRLFEEGPVLERARRIGERVRAPLERLRGRVADVRGLGAIQAVEVEGEEGYLAGVGPRMAAAALRRGVFLRPLGNVLYAMPPFCLTDEEATGLGEAMAEVVEEVGAAGG